MLFVGTKRQAAAAVASEAQRTGQYYVNNRWLGGMLTNFRTVKRSIEDFKEQLEVLEDEEKAAQISKKERARMSRAVEKYRKSLDGIREMSRLPDALFVIDVGCEHIALTEARRLGIPVVAIVDHEERVRKPAHLADAVERLPVLLDGARHRARSFFDRGLLLVLEDLELLLKSSNQALSSTEVGEHPRASGCSVIARCAAPRRRRRRRPAASCRRRAPLAARRDGLAQEVDRLVHARGGRVEIQDVDACGRRGVYGRMRGSQRRVCGARNARRPRGARER